MTKMYESGKRKKRWIVGLSLTMAAVLSLGIFSACKTTDEETSEEEEESAALPTDTQLLKNGNFEFYSEMTKEEKELKAVLNTPTSWSFSSGSPSSDTKSGLVDLKYWNSITVSKYEYQSVADAYSKWDDGNIYDKLKFFQKTSSSADENKAFKDAYDALATDSDEKKFFTEHSFTSIDFEDVEYLNELGSEIKLHDDDKTLSGDEKTQREKGELGVLMIHNRRTSDGAVGTAQSYSSSTSITLKAGTAAEISVWVKTAKLRHYYSDLKEDDDKLDGLEVTKNAGAYIGVTQTVGGTTLDQLQIKNINTEATNKGSSEENNYGWEQYKVYVRASTFATTTVKLVLGLGQGNSDNRREAVNGYALFDDIQCKIIGHEAYETATSNDNLAPAYKRTITSEKKDKLFDATDLYLKKAGDEAGYTDYSNTFALDLFAGFNNFPLSDISFGLTEEKSGNNVYTSAKIDAALNDNSTEEGATNNIAALKSFNQIQNESTNGYLKSIAQKDFDEDKYPFDKDDNNQLIFLLSANGAAYTAKTGTLSLGKDERKLISFFVKTSKVINGRTGASVTLVDESGNKTTISAFDSTTVDKVDIDDNTKDIYDGWVQCFFFVSNETERTQTYTLEFSLGPTSIASSTKYAYGQGYAAFANFETKELTKTELSYASTGDKAKKVSLSEVVEDTTVFDSATASSDIENGLGIPANFQGVRAGSKWMDSESEIENTVPADVLTGLLNYKHADNYNDLVFSSFSSKTGDEAWKELFGDKYNPAKTALQPLVIMNKGTEDAPSYGYRSNTVQTISADSYQKISVRVKLSAGAKATVYLTDTSEFGENNKFLAPNAPKVTYWYDEDGNICKSDPTKKDFNKNTGTLFVLQTNGLYRKADSTDTSYYANLKNYNVKDGNLVLGDDATIAFYGKDNQYFAYRTENADGTYTYDVPVKDLYENGGKEFARYDYTQTAFPESVITVENDSAEATDWITVSFYVHTGNEAKSYRLELWAGARDNATDGIKAGKYVLFDRYSSTSVSNYDTLLEKAVLDLEDEPDKVGENGKLKDAFYYTFTFYDSANYLRYDVNEDEDGVGNPYASYDQSAHSEELIYLAYNDLDGERTGIPSYTRFLNYAASEQTVTPDTPADEDDTTDEEESEPISTGDILLICSSALLGVVLVFVIVMLLVRRFAKKHPKKVRVAPVKDNRYKPAEKVADKTEEEEENPFVKNRKAKEEPAAPETEAPAEDGTDPAPADSDKTEE